MSPWNYPLYFGMPIVDRPLRGQPGEGIGTLHILGNTLPDFRLTFNNTIQYKRLTLYGLLDGTFGHKIQNQGEGWGILDFSSAYFDQGGQHGRRRRSRSGTAGALGRIGGRRHRRVLRHPWTEQLQHRERIVREASRGEPDLSRWARSAASAAIGRSACIGRNLIHLHALQRLRSGSRRRPAATPSSGLINQVDAFDFPTLRTFTFTISTRF